MFDFLKLDGSVIVVFVAIIIIALLFAYLGSRYKVAGANEALIRSGRATPLGGGEAGLKVVRGQGIVVLPLFHKIGKLKLTARQINVESRRRRLAPGHQGGCPGRRHLQDRCRRRVDPERRRAVPRGT